MDPFGWPAEAMPEGIAIAGGYFDAPHWISRKLHVWTAKSLPWFKAPDNIVVFATSPK